MSVEPWLIHSMSGVARGHAVDIGANVGSWTRLLAADFALVTAVEADERAYGVLSSELPGNAVAIHGAACDRDGEISLYKRPSSEQTSLLEVHPIGAGGCAAAPVHEVVTVKAHTLDGLCPQGADFIKIDIEGAEVAVLSAASASVWARATFLVECHDTFDGVAKELERLGKAVERVPHPIAGAHPGHCWAIGRPRGRDASMILITESFEPADQRRREEIDQCRKANKASGLFAATVAFSAGDSRLRYGTVFRECAARWPGRLCVLANADIRFDESVLLLPRVVERGRLVTLTRWDNPASPLMWGYQQGGRFYSGTQDVWAFIGGDHVGLGDDIPLGYVGCDQAIVGEVVQAGGSVVNPALSIKAWHVHADAARGKRPAVSGVYGYPELTTLQTTGNYITHPWPQDGDNENKPR